MFLRALLPLLLVGAPSRRVLLASASTIKDAEVDKCITCVTASSSESSASSFSFSWTDGTCSPGTTCSDSSDPGTGPTCCVDDRCCSEDGCRSPDDSYFPDNYSGGTSCEQCCDEVPTSNGDGVECKIRSWSDEFSKGSATATAPWYNDEKDVPGGCEESCPPCAVCSSRDESELTDLASGRSADLLDDCTAEMCEEKKSVEYFADPCQFNSAAGDCDCFCSMANPLLDDCPHLSEEVFNGTGGGNAQQEPAQDDPVQEDPVQDTQSQDDAGQQDGSAGGTGAEPVDDSFGDVPAGEKQVGRSTSGAAGGVASACVRATLSAGCLAGAIVLVLS